MRKNRARFESGRVKNLKMNDETYKLRRKVMDIIYDVKRRMKIDLPRVDVRITENSREFSGLAMMNDNIIWIPERTVKVLDLRMVVLHEILHACFGIGHDPLCPLMKAEYEELSSTETDNLFMKWVQKSRELLPMSL